MNKQKPFFSVIVLAYQVGDYIEECLESVLQQSFQDFEIILVNPVSQDKTDSVCKKYAEEFFKIKWIRINNKGQLLNRIEGFSASTGQYLLCLDGDDRWHPDLLQSIYQEITQKKCDVVIFGHQRFNDNCILGEILHVFPNKSVFSGDGKKRIYEKLISGSPINEMCMKVISKDIFVKIKEDFNKWNFLRYAEDALYSCYVVQEANSILYLDLPLYQYRIRDTSVSHVFRADELYDFITVKTKIKEFMISWQMDQPKYRKLFYENISRYFADWIYRCAISNLPFKEKKALYRCLRKETLYFESLPFQNRKHVRLRHRPFAFLFRYSNVLLEGYSKIFLLIKCYDKRKEL